MRWRSMSACREPRRRRRSFRRPGERFSILLPDYCVAVRRLPIVLLLLLLAGCGSSKEAATTTAPAAPEPPSPASAVDGTVLYEGGDWAGVTPGNKAGPLPFRNADRPPDRTGTPV